jgi:hypothetical protein
MKKYIATSIISNKLKPIKLLLEMKDIATLNWNKIKRNKKTFAKCKEICA